MTVLFEWPPKALGLLGYPSFPGFPPSSAGIAPPCAEALGGEARGAERRKRRSPKAFGSLWWRPCSNTPTVSIFRCLRNSLFPLPRPRYDWSVHKLIETCLMLSRAILGDTRVRRQWMFMGTLLVLGFVFGGYFLAAGFLRSHPIVFALYVLASLGGVLFLVLFALYDMLMVRREFLEARRAAHEEMVRAMKEDQEGGGGGQ